VTAELLFIQWVLPRLRMIQKKQKKISLVNGCNPGDILCSLYSRI